MANSLMKLTEFFTIGYFNLRFCIEKSRQNHQFGTEINPKNNTMSQQITDYLQTQALKLNRDDVAIGRATAQAVLCNGQAHIDLALLQHAQLPDDLSAQLPELKRMFMALDSVYSRHPVQTAVVYALLPDAPILVRVAQMGQAIENALTVNEEQAWQYLAVRSAHSGWANIATDTAQWLQQHELQGEHNLRAICQTSLPIHSEDGVVYGVLHLESSVPLADEALAEWVGLALALLPILHELLPRAVEVSE